MKIAAKGNHTVRQFQPEIPNIQSCRIVLHQGFKRRQRKTATLVERQAIHLHIERIVAHKPQAGMQLQSADKDMPRIKTSCFGSFAVKDIVRHTAVPKRKSRHFETEASTIAALLTSQAAYNTIHIQWRPI